MTQTTQIFQFHDIATVKVLTDSPFVKTFFEAEYSYHRVSPTSEQQQDSNIRYCGFSENLPHAFLDFSESHSSPEDHTAHSHKFLARWGYKLTIKPGTIDIHANGNQTAVSMIHHMLLHPSIRWLACNNGTLLLHAGSVVKNNKSLVFTGKGGAGKTTITSLVLASGQGWQIHADDYVFLNGELSKAYITRSHLYRDLLNWVPVVGTRLTHWERIRLEFFGALRKYTNEGIKWPVRVNPQHLWPGSTIADTATPAAILLLERSDVSHPVLIRLNNLEETINDLLDMNFGEARHFISLLQKTGTLEDKWLEAWKASERALITNLLYNNPAYRLVLPLSQSARDTQADLIPLLEDLVT